MADAGLFIAWQDAARGRERMAMELFQETMAYYQTKVADGTIESFEPVLLSRHGGDLNGFILIRGEGGKLDAWRRSKEFQDRTLKGLYCLDGFGVVDAHMGAELMERMQGWGAIIAGD
jgi:hypothetical protein